MGVSNRVPDMTAKWARELADAKDIADATAAVQQFYASAKAKVGTIAWPTIGAAPLLKHHRAREVA